MNLAALDFLIGVLHFFPAVVWADVVGVAVSAANVQSLDRHGWFWQATQKMAGRRSACSVVSAASTTLAGETSEPSSCGSYSAASRQPV